jgi:hypothetical protein
MNEEPTAIRLISETFTAGTVLEASKAAVQNTTNEAVSETTSEESIGIEKIS